MKTNPYYKAKQESQIQDDLERLARLDKTDAYFMVAVICVAVISFASCVGIIISWL